MLSNISNFNRIYRWKSLVSPNNLVKWYLHIINVILCSDSVSRCCAWLLLRWPWSSPLSRMLHLHSPLWPSSSPSTSPSWCSLCLRYMHSDIPLLHITSTFTLVWLYGRHRCLIVSDFGSFPCCSFVFCHCRSALGLCFDLSKRYCFLRIVKWSLS